MIIKMCTKNFKHEDLSQVSHLCHFIIIFTIIMKYQEF